MNKLFVKIPSCAILPRNILHFRAHRWVNINLCTFWRLHLCRGTARGSSAVCHAWSVTPTIHHLPNSPKNLVIFKIDRLLFSTVFSPYCLLQAFCIKIAALCRTLLKIVSCAVFAFLQILFVLHSTSEKLHMLETFYFSH